MTKPMPEEIGEMVQLLEWIRGTIGKSGNCEDIMLGK